MKRLLLVLLATGALHAQQFGESIEVRIINVDVVVTGRDGKPLPDLKREDFELYENGKRVAITNFSAVIEGKLDVAAADTPSSSEPVRVPMTWAVFVDQTNLKPGTRNEALRQVRTFLDKALSPGDSAIVATADGNAFRVRGTATSDKAAFSKTLDALQRERVNPGPAYSKEILLRAEIEHGGDPKEIGIAISVMIEDEAVRTRNTIRGLESFLDLLSGVDGRVAVIYVGAGFKTLPAMGVTELWRRNFPLMAAGMVDAPRPEAKRELLRRDVTRALERMLAMRATMYTINASAAGPLGPIETAGDADTAAPFGDVGELHEAGSVREMADRTGGLSFKLGPQLSTQLDAVTTDLSHYYSLGYRPTGPTRGLRDLTVKVNVPGARVRYREATRERTPEEQAADAVVAALFHPREQNPLGVTVEVSKSKGKKIPIRVRLPLKSLTFLPEGDVHRGGVFFHFAVAAPDGTVWKLESRELPLEIPANELAAARTQNITYSAEVPARVRDLRLAVSVMDRVGQVRSVLTVPLE